MKPKYSILMALLLGFAPVSASEPQKAENFSLPDLSDKTVRLEDYKGKITVLDFWATWCITCRKVFPILKEIYMDYPRDQVEVIGISLDEKPADHVRRFARETNLPYIILHDPKGAVPKQYGVVSLPTVFIIGPEGQILLEKTGFEDDEPAQILTMIKNLVSNNRTIPDTLRTGQVNPAVAEEAAVSRNSEESH